MVRDTDQTAEFNASLFILLGVDIIPLTDKIAIKDVPKTPPYDILLITHKWFNIILQLEMYRT